MLPFLVAAAIMKAREKQFQLAKEDSENISKSIIEEREKSWSPIFQAVLNRNNNLLKKILASGEYPDVLDFDKTTPLSYAAMFDNLDAVEMLLTAGADPNSRDWNGSTPLHHTISSEVAELLIKAGANVDSLDRSHCTPLHSISGSGSSSAVSTLLKYGANINAKDMNNYTPLHHAVDYQQLDNVIMLVNEGANLNIRNNDWRTPLKLADYQNFYFDSRKSKEIVNVIATKKRELASKNPGCFSRLFCCTKEPLVKEM